MLLIPFFILKKTSGFCLFLNFANFRPLFFLFAKAERVHELNEEIGKLLAKVEQLGADGNVEESQKVMDEVEKARAKKREAEVI